MVDLSASRVSQTILTLWREETLNCKTWSTNSLKDSAHMELTEKFKVMVNSMRSISSNVTIANHWRKCPTSNTWVKPCQNVAPAKQKSAHGSPQQRWPDWKEQYQFPDQVQALQIAGRLYPPLRVGNLDTPGWDGEKKGLRHWRTSDWENSSASPTANTKWTTINGARLKVSWADRNLFSPLLSAGRWHGLATSHDMIAYTKPSREALSKSDAGGDGSSRSSQYIGTFGEADGMDMSSLL